MLVLLYKWKNQKKSGNDKFFLELGAAYSKICMQREVIILPLPQCKGIKEVVSSIW
jgi:hypothetical protein